MKIRLGKQKTRTPENLIGGYPDSLFDLSKAYLLEDSALAMDNFGFFTKVSKGISHI